MQYVNGDRKPRSISSDDVNVYLREISGRSFTAKEFRTWAGTVLAVRELQELGQFDTERQAARQLVAAIKAVAKELGEHRRHLQEMLCPPGRNPRLP